MQTPSNPCRMQRTAMETTLRDLYLIGECREQAIPMYKALPGDPDARRVLREEEAAVR